MRRLLQTLHFFNPARFGSQALGRTETARAASPPRSMSRNGRLREIPAATFPLLILVASIAIWPGSAKADPIRVRFLEGLTHGLLVLRAQDGRALAQGDLIQVDRGGRIESRLVFHFKDGSLHDEIVEYTQRDVFTLRSYRLVQRGPSFEESLDLSVDRSTGRYTVRSRESGEKEDDVDSGTLELPPDVYNGMVPIVLKNLDRTASMRVHMIGFMPKPRVVEVEIEAEGREPILAGETGSTEATATRYVLRPKLGLLKPFASLLGKVPAETRLWILTEEAPAFVAFEGPLYLKTPVWRIELVSPRRAR